MLLNDFLDAPVVDLGHLLLGYLALVEVCMGLEVFEAGEGTDGLCPEGRVST